MYSDVYVMPFSTLTIPHIHTHTQVPAYKNPRTHPCLTVLCTPQNHRPNKSDLDDAWKHPRRGYGFLQEMYYILAIYVIHWNSRYTMIYTLFLDTPMFIRFPRKRGSTVGSKKFQIPIEHHGNPTANGYTVTTATTMTTDHGYKSCKSLAAKGYSHAAKKSLAERSACYHFPPESPRN